MFSAASGRGLIEALASRRGRCRRPRFPRHRAAASLKLADGHAAGVEGSLRFPRHRAAASLKHSRGHRTVGIGHRVFRGIGPRPH